ncbi:Reverse transcriptase domain-containing protein, partial [Aphis craccivora]
MCCLPPASVSDSGGCVGNVKKVYTQREKQRKRYGSKALGLVSSGGLRVDHIWDVTVDYDVNNILLLPNERIKLFSDSFVNSVIGGRYGLSKMFTTQYYKANSAFDIQYFGLPTLRLPTLDEGLRVNEENTKYLMVARRSPNTDHITVDDYSFKKVEVFKYLGVNINSNNDMHEEINDRIACGNRCYYSIIRLLKSKLLSRNSKTLLYHSYLQPIITYASETWSLTKGDSKRLMTFERKVLRNIYGPKFDAESQTYERRNNQELQELYNRPNII